MKRRSFFQSVVAAAASLLFHREVEESYLYDWKNGVTDDPKLKGRLPYMFQEPNMRLSVDGEELDLFLFDYWICECKSGKNGHVIGIVREKDGCPAFDYPGKLQDIARARGAGSHFMIPTDQGPVNTTSMRNTSYVTNSLNQIKCWKLTGDVKFWIAEKST